ncbi:hypothetical protein [Actinospica sp.]|jgi:hypothetical protein|uniref:hypothetical protein n=1 Tax=Actinospica sp. TaxID=1872142 RepID=UPI002C65E776|nr:hypothetical protein [Actinospica sp.]HWG25072.1 hypothetical protein [Actinospica sp.]
MGDFAQYPHVQMPVAGSVHEPADVSERGRQTVPAISRVPRRSRPTLWIAGAGALAYSSWPLAFLVNPSLAGSALASSFEGRSQPFSWLFILLDCVAGLCTGVVCIRELRPRPSLPRPAKVLVLALLGYGVFGVATAVDAVVPLNCGSTSVQACASQIWPLTPDDFLTGTAVFALFVASVAVIVEMTRRPLAFPSFVPVVITITLIAWGGLGLTVLMPVTSDTAAVVCQYAFLTLTSVLTFVIPLGAASARRRSTADVTRFHQRLLPRAQVRRSHRFIAH